MDTIFEWLLSNAIVAAGATLQALAGAYLIQRLVGFPNLLDRIQNIFKMMEDFYRELERSSLRSMFPHDMVAASRKSAAFFVGLLKSDVGDHSL